MMQEERREGDPGWSPDGNSLIFGAGSFASGKFAIYQLDLRTKEVSQLPGSEGLFGPRWSADGRQVVALRVGIFNLMLFDFKSGKWVELTSYFGGWPRWSRDGKYVYIHYSAAGEEVLSRIEVRGRKIERLVRLEGMRRVGIFGSWVGWTPDDSPLVLRDIGTQDVYALEWQTPEREK
ncbi:MAG: hypothetical protein M3430_12960 [Acidobacteriota bacterium]|nr:hypothetical protein [Acidobacteriota bacterium]